MIVLGDVITVKQLEGQTGRDSTSKDDAVDVSLAASIEEVALESQEFIRLRIKDPRRGRTVSITSDATR